MRVVALIQVRMSSSRFPGKVMAELAGKPTLWHIMNRLSFSSQLDAIVIATSTEPANDSIRRFASDQGFACFSGSENDVLDRLYQGARLHGADAIVRITGDCPLVDPALVD